MRRISFLLAFLVLLSVIPVALAGGWATIALDEPPGEIRAGETWVAGLTVFQHGVTPVHDLGEGVPIEPTLVATNAATGEKVVAIARPDDEIGRFTLEVTFPSEGEWQWTIYPAPLAGETQFKPLTVLPPVPVVDTRSVSAAALGDASLPLVIGITALVVVLGALPWLVSRTRNRQARA